MKILCKLGVHDWVTENSYTGSSESGYVTTGHARMCGECGLIETYGTAHVPAHWKRWQGSSVKKASQPSSLCPKGLVKGKG
jgi:hypothetical protein